MDMRLLFLGTAAAEAWPGVFCRCEACQKARKLGGKDLRTRSSLMIDDNYKIDFPPDTYAHVLRENLDLSKLEHLLITHGHEDHLYPADLAMRSEPYAHISDAPPLAVYGNAYVLQRIEAALSADELQGVRLQLVEAGRPFTAGAARVTPLTADHLLDKGAFTYLIEHQGRTIFYGLDSGWYPEATWELLRRYRLDMAILDCTHGSLPQERNHMGIEQVIKVKQALLAQGSAGPETVFVADHFSHNGLYLHHQLEAAFSPHGIRVAHDGMTLEI